MEEIHAKCAESNNDSVKEFNETIVCDDPFTSFASKCPLSEEFEKRLTLNGYVNGLNGPCRSKDLKLRKPDDLPKLENASVTSSERSEAILNSSGDSEELHKECDPPIYPPINYVQYESEEQMPMIMKIIQKDLSEPYSIYTFRYFIHNWPKLCFLAMSEGECVGAIVCKLDIHRKTIRRGYIAMLAVDKSFRKRSIGTTLVTLAIREMTRDGADEVVLETEVTNKPALRLYEALGFVRDKRLFRYYLNGVDALRLKLWIR